MVKSAAKTPRERNNRTSASSVGVYLRLRPLKLEDPTLLKIDDQQVKTLPPDGSSQQVYSFTQVFDNAPQSEIFSKVAKPVVEQFVLNAKDGLVFTYGITGSGKTYTMEGLKNDPGLIYRTIDFLFNSIASQQTLRCLIEPDGQNSYKITDQLYPDLARAETPAALPSTIKWQNRAKETSSVAVDPDVYFCLFITLVELYNKNVYDLLDDTVDSNAEKRKREIRTDANGISYVARVVEVEVKSADEAVAYYTSGIRKRKTGSTALNQDSSRGHCVLNLRLVQVRKKTYDDCFDGDTLISSQLCLVDLAGSERTKRSGATGGALHEACNINNSLGALRKCIRALRDREPTNNIQYREYSLTRLFKSYFEGHGSVCMVLCVKPTAADFHENNIAMEFGLLTQDVAADYASPPKQLKRSKTRGPDTNFAAMYEYIEKRLSHYEPNPELTDEEFISNWINKVKSNRDRRKKFIETALGAQNEVRQNILKTVEKNSALRQQFDSRAKDIKCRDEQLELLESKLNTTVRSRDHVNERVKQLERQVRELETRNKQARIIVQEHEIQQANTDKICKDLLNYLKCDRNKNDALKKIELLLKKMRAADWTTSQVPSAPEMEPLHSSSPVDVPNPSTTETDSNTVPTTTNSSSEAMEYHDHRVSTSPVKTMTSPNGGVPVVNPRHNRSLSCSSMQWIHHKPQGTIDTGTVLKPKFKNGRSVKNLRSSDILRKDAGGYSVVHQDADPNGDVETSIYKGHIISTVCGGAQVILNDIETMRQVSPKRKRAASDAHFTH